MPIHEAGYRAYTGPMLPPGSRWLAIVRNEFGLAFRNKKMLALYAACITPSIFLLVVVYLRYFFAGLGEGGDGRNPFAFDRGAGPFRNSILNPGLARFYLDTVILQGGFFAVVIYSTVVGSGIIARDRRSNAIELYMTRAVTAARYAAGKWLGVASLLGMQIVVPTLAVWLFAVFLAPDWGLLQDTIQFMPRVLAALCVFCLFHGFLVTAISASTDSPVFAALLWVTCMSFLSIMALFLRNNFGLSFWTVLSPWQACNRIVEAIAGVAAGADYELTDAGLALGLFVGLSILLIRRGLRRVEAVG